MRALQFSEFGPVSNLRLVELPDPKADETTAIVKVAAGSITPSDVKNVEGKMEGTTLPRVPGRDYAGTVVEGPARMDRCGGLGDWRRNWVLDQWQPRRVYRRPGGKSSAQAADALAQQAAAAGVTYLAAWLGLIEYAQIGAGETLLVIGANGGVGSAVAAARQMERCTSNRDGHWPVRRKRHLRRALSMISLCEDRPLEIGVRELTKGRGADVVFDSVGGPMFEPALKSLTHRGRLRRSLGRRPSRQLRSYRLLS